MWKLRNVRTNGGRVLAEKVEKKEDYKNILNRYEKKAELLRQAHSDLYSKYKTYSDRVTIITIILSALITFFSLTDLAKIFEPFGMNVNNNKFTLFSSLFLASFGFIIFIFSLLNFIYGWQDKYLKHESGVKLITSFITNIKDVSDSMENGSIDIDKIENKIEEINERYILICEILPIIPDQEFLNSKQKYKIKRKISEELDSDPCTDVNLGKYLKKCEKEKK